ncbi:hypothetical protein [Trichocoleus sp. FACHB-40]|uniref:hypothetical protein n=1 Tax=Trichocoleus sp. FACHB-40 TaxID=2692870 RepID=UPI0016831C8B|nr:hypothetical protein [Trichocoleus sp. FACHB-40]MBD2006329.1 hypothetical protein [Trichocoleus sp. FACHB-40]
MTQVRPRISRKLYRLVRLGAAVKEVSERDWLAEAIQEKAAREKIQEVVSESFSSVPT